MCIQWDIYPNELVVRVCEIPQTETPRTITMMVILLFLSSHKLPICGAYHINPFTIEVSWLLDVNNSLPHLKTIINQAQYMVSHHQNSY